MTKTAKEWTELYNSPKWQGDNLYNGSDLGATCRIGGSSVKLWSPVADQVTLNFYKDGEPETKSYWSEPMRRDSNGVWSYHIPENLHGTYYDFTLLIDGDLVQAADPWARAAGINGLRSMAVDLSLTNPDGWGYDVAPPNQAEQIISEVHIKEFSWDDQGGWPSEVRGKYLALTYSETSLKSNKGQPTGLAQLRKLGITHLQIMPIFDYGSVDEASNDDQFNWGYDPVNYNVPEGSYSLDPHHGETRINELKQAIQSLHRNGFRVVMDVVYNHTYNLDGPLQKTAPYYYYRTWPDGSLSNGSGCGNDIASERPMASNYILYSVLYWAKEYHIDGFRFDLMGLLDVKLMNRIRSALDNKYGVGEKLVYGEPWAADNTAVDNQTKLANWNNMGLLDSNIGAFCDQTRDAIKGSAGDLRNPGFVNGASGLEWKILNGVKAWVLDDSQVKAPSQIVNYVSAHDNQTLWDKLSETTPDESLRLQQYKLAVAIYLTSQGRPFMLSGSAFLRSKGGRDNTHSDSISINRLKWGELDGKSNITDYYSGLIALRQKLPGLYDKSAEAVTRIGATWATDGMVGFMVDNTDESNTSPWSYLCIIYNRNQKQAKVELEEGDWEILSNEQDTWQWQNPNVISGKATINEVGWVILGQRKQ